MRRAIERLRFAVDALPPILARLTDAEAAQPQGPGRWSKKEVVGHLIDSASNNHQRFVRAQLSGSGEFPDYAQEEWVRVQRYASAPWIELVELWRMYNAHLARVVEAMPEEARGAKCRVARGPEVTLEWLVADYVDHLEHHLRKMLGTWPVAPQ
jgi:hypothetical protein